MKEDLANKVDLNKADDTKSSLVQEVAPLDEDIKSADQNKDEGVPQFHVTMDDLVRIANKSTNKVGTDPSMLRSYEDE